MKHLLLNKGFIVLVLIILNAEVICAQWVPTSGSLDFISTNHISSVGSYGFDIESHGSNQERWIINNLSGVNRQAFYFGHANSSKNIFGISTSANSGSTWNPRFAITQYGNVGIGTQNPSSKFHIFSSGSDGIYIESVGWSELDMVSSSGSNDFRTKITQSSVDGTLQFRVGQGSSGVDASSDSKLTISEGGDIGIGVNSPTAKLHIAGINNSSGTTLQLNSRIKFRGDGVMKWGSSASHGILSWDTGKVIIGSQAGNDYSLIAGGSEKMIIKTSGNIGIGTTSPDEKLTVNGTVHSEEVRVEVVNPPDYVFDETYKLPSLEETEAYIKQNHHLPEVPSAAEMQANGVELGKMNMLLLQKIEEITLHMIEQQKEIKTLKKEVLQLKTINR